MSQFEENKKKVFAKKLKGLMKAWSQKNGRKLTQDMLASKLFVSRETVSAWLNEKNYPPKGTIQMICKFFSVPENYFRPRFIYNDEEFYDESLLMDEEYHIRLGKQCEKAAQDIGLNPAFLQFIKDSPTIQDRIMVVSEMSDSECPCEIVRMPDNPDERLRVYQFAGSNGEKVYLPQDVLSMLRVVQRDLLEYAEFLVNKWSKVFEDIYECNEGKEWHHHFPCSRAQSGEERNTTSNRFFNEMKGMGSLTWSESVLVDMYRLKSPEEQDKMVMDAMGCIPLSPEEVEEIRQKKGK